MSHPFRPVFLEGSTSVPLFLRLVLSMLVTGAIPFGAVGVDVPADVRFNRDIKPLLAENCLACHGPDPGSRKAGLRLDTKAGLFEATEKRGPAVVPGDLERSELWRRVTTADEDDVMPPPKSNKVLKPEQRELLRRWIAGGAAWEGHWSFGKPERPPLPQVRDAGWVRNPIDAFVLSRLEAEGLQPAPEADRRTLARRVSLDLTGLPPAPALVERFVKDRSADAYEKLVRRLINSEQWGEHRARYWLDAARYADTHGLHFDNYREMWPYRDYVIRAFNRNLSFDQFIIEQIAGDLLDQPTDDQLVATGFQRCNMTTNEGGTIEEENLANYANDRVTTFGWVFLGLTANCASCHDHKFDPITTADFYSLSAFFRNTEQSGFDRNWREGDLYMVVPQTESDRARWKALPDEITAARKDREALVPALDAAFTNWVLTARPSGLTREPRLSGEYLRLPLAYADGEGAKTSGRIEGRTRDFEWSGPVEHRGGPFGAAPVLGKDSGIQVGDAADVDAGDPFSVGAWVHVPADFKTEGSVLARMAGEEGHHRGWDLFVKEDHFGVHLINRWPSISLKVQSKDQSMKRGEWHHLVATYDGSSRAEGVKLFLDGVEVPVNRDQDRLEGSIRSALPLRVGRREKGNELVGAAVQEIRIYRRRLDPSEVAALSVAPRAAQILAMVDFTSTNNTSRDLLRSYYRAVEGGEWRKATHRLNLLENERDTIRGRSPVTHIQREKRDSEPMAHILFRGQYDKPRDRVSAATPAALHPFPAGAPRNRLGLARWLVDPENPLTARVTVNRFWQEIFGTGLVRTAEDFGSMGEAPVNPELLDWLAVEFRESGWDVKHVFSLLVTSAAYRQAAVITPEKLAKDPHNRYLSRGPRFRMDAEMVRDYALASSGLLVARVGGASVKPPQPEGVWEAVAMPESNTRHYIPDPGNAGHRRSLYSFWKRAAPPPTLDLFNAPSRETCTVRRERTNTPLQALATLNNPQFLEAAVALAETAYARTRGRAEAALEFIAQRLLARSLAPEERTIVQQTLAAATNYYEAEPDEGERLIQAAGLTPPASIPVSRLAALTLVANQMLNLDEVLNK